MTIDWALGIAALVQCLALKATKLYIEKNRNTIVSAKKAYRVVNFQACVGNLSAIIATGTGNKNLKMHLFILVVDHQ